MASTQWEKLAGRLAEQKKASTLDLISNFYAARDGDVNANEPPQPERKKTLNELDAERVEATRLRISTQKTENDNLMQKLSTVFANRNEVGISYSSSLKIEADQKARAEIAEADKKAEAERQLAYLKEMLGD